MHEVSCKENPANQVSNVGLQPTNGHNPHTLDNIAVVVEFYRKGLKDGIELASNPMTRAA